MRDFRLREIELERLRRASAEGSDSVDPARRHVSCYSDTACIPFRYAGYQSLDSPPWYIVYLLPCWPRLLPTNVLADTEKPQAEKHVCISHQQRTAAEYVTALAEGCTRCPTTAFFFSFSSLLPHSSPDLYYKGVRIRKQQPSEGHCCS